MADFRTKQALTAELLKRHAKERPMEELSEIQLILADALEEDGESYSADALRAFDFKLFRRLCDDALIILPPTSGPPLDEMRLMLHVRLSNRGIQYF